MVGLGLGALLGYAAIGAPPSAISALHAGHLASTASSLTDRITIPPGTVMTPAAWAHALLAGGGWPRTACNVNAVAGWAGAEGGHWSNKAKFNPLNTTKRMPGSYPINRVAGTPGVQAYRSWADGITATLDTLRNGNYGRVIAALQAGNNAQAVVNAVTTPDPVTGKKWGTGYFQASC